MADIKQAFGSKTNLTITLASLANDALRESDAVDNSANLFLDALVAGFIKSGGSGPGAGDYINIYAYASVDGGTTYSGDATGSDAGYSGEVDNLVHLATITVDAAATTFQFGPFSIAQAFGGFLPDHWGIVVENKSDGALDGTGSNHEIHYKGVYLTSN